MSRSRVSFILFIVSLSILSMLYGTTAVYLGWFPAPQLHQAWEQAERVRETTTLSSQPIPEGLLHSRVYSANQAGAHTVRPEEKSSSSVLIARNWEDMNYHVGFKLLNKQGEVLHAWEVPPKRLFPDFAFRGGRQALTRAEVQTKRDRRIHGMHLFPNGDVLFNIEYGGTVRIDACSNFQWQLPIGSHHSLRSTDQGTFWVATRKPQQPPRSSRHPEGFPGLTREKTVSHEYLTHITADGDVLEQISLLNLLYQNDLERHIFKHGQQDNADPTHLNDIEPLGANLAREHPLFEAGDLLLSLRHLDLVLVVDPETQKIKWHTSHVSTRQHDPDFMAGGWIGIFDNRSDGTFRGEVLGGSRIVAIQPHTDSVQTLFPTSRSEPFYTEFLGNWEQLPNDNLLLTEAEAGRVVEVNPDGETVWEWIAPPFNDEKVAEIFEAHAYLGSRERIREWPCSPSPD